MTAKPSLTLYYREGCHLCEEMAALLYRGWPDLLDDLKWVDIDRDPVLADRYGSRIPVLLRNDQEVCDLRPDAARIQEVFGKPRNPV